MPQHFYEYLGRTGQNTMDGIRRPWQTETNWGGRWALNHVWETEERALAEANGRNGWRVMHVDAPGAAKR